MKIVKKIAIKLGLLGVMLMIFNYIYKYFFYETDLQKYSPIINLIRVVPQDADVVYFGESSNITFRKDDIDKRSISDFLGDFYPDLKVIGVTKPAAHAGIYKVLLEHLKMDSKPKTIVITLNLRSFNAQWIYSDLETPLQKSMVLLKSYPPLFNRFLLSFKAYDIKTKDERSQQIGDMWTKDKFKLPFDFSHENTAIWDKDIAIAGVKNPDGSRNQALTELACHYIKGYAFQIDTITNPRIKDLDEIVALAKKRGWRLVFNLMAENYQKADKLLGKDLLFFMDENRKLLKDYYTRRGVVVVDNLYAVDDNQFVDKNWTTEHYAEKGRKKIASIVADSLRKFYADDYVEAKWKTGFESRVFNDCEGKEIWGQMQTLSQEKSSSGTKSSKTGNGQDFSITFEYPLQNIPESLRNEIDLSCKIFQTSLDHNAKIVIQAEGDSVDYFWQGYSLQDQINNTNSWEDYYLKLKISPNLNKATLIKIYLYNPSEKVIFLDDIQIEFR